MTSYMSIVSAFRDHEVNHLQKKYIWSKSAMLKSMVLLSAIIEKVSLCFIATFMIVETLEALRASIYYPLTSEWREYAFMPPLCS